MTERTVRIVIEGAEFEDAADAILDMCDGEDFASCRKLIAGFLRERSNVDSLRGFERGVATASNIVRATVDNLTAATAAQKELRTHEQEHEQAAAVQ